MPSNGNGHRRHSWNGRSSIGEPGRYFRSLDRRLESVEHRLASLDRRFDAFTEETRRHRLQMARMTQTLARTLDSVLEMQVQLRREVDAVVSTLHTMDLRLTRLERRYR